MIRCTKHGRPLIVNETIVECPDCVDLDKPKIAHVVPGVVVEDIPDWFSAELKHMGDAMSRAAGVSNVLSSGNGPGHVVNHAMVMLLRLVHMDDGSSAVAMLHSALDLAVEQWRQEQN